MSVKSRQPVITYDNAIIYNDNRKCVATHILVVVS